MGSASYTGRGETLDQVIIAADQAMYSVKATHKQKNTKPETTPKPETPASVDPVQLIEPVENISQQLRINEDAFVLELDESHIVSNAVN